MITYLLNKYNLIAETDEPGDIIYMFAAEILIEVWIISLIYGVVRWNLL